VRRKRGELEVTYQFERCAGSVASAPVEWMRLAGWLFRFAPLGIAATPIANSAGTFSALLRTSPTRLPSRPGTMAGSNPEVRLRSITLPDSSKLVRSYDDSGQLTEVTYPDGQTVQYEGQGNTVTLFPGMPRRIAYTRDPAGRPSTIEYAVGPREKTIFTYDWHPNGLLQRVSYPDGVRVQYHWDARGRLEAVTEGQSTISYQWAPSQQLLKVTCSDGKHSAELDFSGPEVVMSWQATARGNPKQTISLLGIHGFDSAGWVDSLLRLDGNRIVFIRDSSQRIARVYTATGATFVTRTKTGAPASLVQPHGERFCWWGSGDTGIALVVGGASIVRAQYNGRGQLSELRDAAGSFVKYGHSRSRPGGCPSSIVSSQWGKIGLQYDSDQRLKSVTWVGRGKCSFNHDADGHLNGLKLISPITHALEIANLAGWWYAVSSMGPAVLADSLVWSHLVR